MASINLDREEYKKGADKLRKSLAINRRIGGKSREAINLFQLGLTAARMGRVEEGLHLVALSVSIVGAGNSSISSEIRPAIDVLISEAGYTEEQFDALCQDVAKTYKRDRGQSLIDTAFQDQNEDLEPEPN